MPHYIKLIEEKLKDSSARDKSIKLVAQVGCFSHNLSYFSVLSSINLGGIFYRDYTVCVPMMLYSKFIHDLFSALYLSCVYIII